MASMHLRVGLYREVDYLLSRRECQRILLDCQEVFSNLIEGYVGEFELDTAVSIYERMGTLGLVPSVSSSQALLKYLVEIGESHLMYHIYVDMVEKGIGRSFEEKLIHENVIRLLCVAGKVQEERDLVKRVMCVGIKPSNLVIDAIICRYCEKKDYDDLLNLFTELRVVPGVILVNKILFSLCKNFGVELADLFLQELEELGFCPDETSLGIFIGSSCREGKLKNAFYLSDILSRGLKPHVYSYNALLGALFKEGMWMHSREVLAEMKDMKVTPHLSTFKVLLGGFCKARQFDEVKEVVSEMEDQLVKLSSSEDLQTKGFMLLGLNPMTVKIRRDNDKGFSKTEFYDKFGNGLYLDTDLDEFEKRVTRVLDDAVTPDFNSYIIWKHHSLDINGILRMVDEMRRWGQEMSLPALSSWFSCLSSAPFGIKIINHQLAVLSKSTYQLDQATLNTVVQIFCRKGFTFRARAMFHGMMRRGFKIHKDTYSALLFEICKKGDLRSLHYYLKLARECDWSPSQKDGNALMRYLCKNKWFSEALELFETMFVSSYDTLDIFHSLIEELCCQALTTAACVLCDGFSDYTSVMDHTAYSHLISGFFQERRLTEAFKVLDIMLSRNLLPPLEVSTLLISQLCRINYVKPLN